MRFTDFLKATVLICAAAASALAAVTVAAATADGNPRLVLLALAWWVLAVAVGAFLGRRAETSPPIGRLLAAARMTQALPEVRPARILLNRLWPLVLVTLVSGALAFVFPQVPAIAAGFATIWALTWRRQEAAVTAIEERDGARFYVERTSPLRAISLVRVPGFKSNLYELDGAAAAAGRRAS